MATEKAHPKQWLIPVYSSIKRLVEDYGKENILVLVPLRPVHHMFFLSYTSSNDEPVVVPCNLIEEKYQIAEDYKVEVQSTYPAFGKETFYQMDFNSLWEKGLIQVYLKVLKS